jgi:hypothetical protein
MPDTIREKLENVKPTVSALSAKLRVIEDLIVDFTAARNRLVYTGLTNPTLNAQIDGIDDLITQLTITSDKIKEGFRNMLAAIKKARGTRGGGSYDVDNIMDALNDLDTTDSNLIGELNDELDKLGDMFTMTGSGRKARKSRKSRKTRKSKKTSKK